MDVAARLTSKGQITLPKPVREALGLEEGDQVVFRVEGDRAVLARTADLLEVAGTVAVPAAKRGTPWEEVRRQVRAARSRTRR
jgi:AbrB family looped-hinge helix DNA binding protein